LRDGTVEASFPRNVGLSLYKAKIHLIDILQGYVLVSQAEQLKSIIVFLTDEERKVLNRRCKAGLRRLEHVEPIKIVKRKK